MTIETLNLFALTSALVQNVLPPFCLNLGQRAYAQEPVRGVAVLHQVGEEDALAALFAKPTWHVVDIFASIA